MRVGLSLMRIFVGEMRRGESGMRLLLKGKEMPHGRIYKIVLPIFSNNSTLTQAFSSWFPTQLEQLQSGMPSIANPISTRP